MFPPPAARPADPCRAPRGARGLKCSCHRMAACLFLSRPARGAWVEICYSSFPLILIPASRAPQGARGLKFLLMPSNTCLRRRAPQGARGLKYLRMSLYYLFQLSRPARGAWVEISPSTESTAITACRAPQGARGLKRSRILIAVSLHKKEVSANRQRLPFIFLFY